MWYNLHIFEFFGLSVGCFLIAVFLLRHLFLLLEKQENEFVCVSCCVLFVLS